MKTDNDLIKILVGLNAALFCTDGLALKIITVPHINKSRLGDISSLLSGGINQASTLTLEKEMLTIIFNLTSIQPKYIEQLYTFADKGRDPRELIYKSRVISIAYMGVVKHSHISDFDNFSWEGVYQFLPWEDKRYPDKKMVHLIEDFLIAWSQKESDLDIRKEKKNRIDICFGTGSSQWDAYKVLDRYELLYESKFLQEYFYDQGKQVSHANIFTGIPMAFDHRRILATALARIRGKLRYRPLAFDFLPEEFTLLDLQNVVEELTGTLVHKQNFRRLIENAKLVEGTGKKESNNSGRPAELFRFRKAVLIEKKAPGLGGIKSLK